MNWSKLVRQSHRWLAIVFTLIVIANFVVLGFGQQIMWLYYLPLPPLFLMMFTGLYMFAQPYVVKWREARRSAS
ncbi:MAG: hypothetical protein ABIO40_05880 [Devosia sp.]